MDTETTMMVEKEIVIGRSRDDTFRLFTEGLGEWWPIPTHSIHGDDVVAAILEPRAGGRLYERTTDGTECEWGTIVEWNAPDGFSVSWKPNLDDDAHRTTWTVRFEATSTTPPPGSNSSTRDGKDSVIPPNQLAACTQPDGTSSWPDS